MWIKPTRSLIGDYGRLRRNHPVRVPKHYGDQLVARGMAVLHKAEAKNPPKPSPTGGQAGKAQPSPSSQAAPAQKAPKSN